MSDKQSIKSMLIAMGFQEAYINRAFKVYEKNYGNSYNVEVITEIIVRLQNKDKKKTNSPSIAAEADADADVVIIKNNKPANSPKTGKKHHKSSKSPASKKHGKNSKSPKKSHNKKNKNNDQQYQNQSPNQSQSHSNAEEMPPPAFAAPSMNMNGGMNNMQHQQQAQGSQPQRNQYQNQQNQQNQHLPMNQQNQPWQSQASQQAQQQQQYNNSQNGNGNNNLMGMSRSMGSGQPNVVVPQANQNPSDIINKLNMHMPQAPFNRSHSNGSNHSGGNSNKQGNHRSVPPPPSYSDALQGNEFMVAQQINASQVPKVSQYTAASYANQQQPPQPQQQQQHHQHLESLPHLPPLPQQNQQNGVKPSRTPPPAYQNSNQNSSQSQNQTPSNKKTSFNLSEIVTFKDNYNCAVQGQIMTVRQGKYEVSYPVQQHVFSRQRVWLKADELQRVNENKHSRQQPPGPPQSKPSKKNKHKAPAAPPSPANNHKHSNHSNHSPQPMQVSASPPSSAKSAKSSKSKPVPRSSSKNSHKANNGQPSFESHMTFEEADKLRLHDKIDHRDQVGRFVYATIVEKQNTNLKIHYDGWSRKWDTWSDYGLEINKFGKAASISKRPAHRFKQLKKGDYVDLNPVLRHPGWKCGEIRRLDQKSGQVQVVYECNDKNYLYWAHLDNRNEIAEFTSQSGTDQTLQKQVENKISKKKSPQQQNNGQYRDGGGYGQGGQPGFPGSGRYEQPQHQQQRFDQYGQPIGNNFGRGGGHQNGGGHGMRQPYQTQPLDEMEQFRKIRAKRFPCLPDEVVSNPFNVGDWLEVQDTQTEQWVTATVIDKESNWIVVHFDGWPSKYDQKIHCVKHETRLRALGSGLQITKEEKEIKEEMDNFLREVETFAWQLVEVDADGNCLYRCFAREIYNDSSKHMQVRADCCQYMRDNKEFFQNFILGFDERMTQKEQQFEWGDHVDITALSELYNVRVRVFEYSKQDKKLYMSFDQGEHEDTLNLPLVLLARHRKKHYNVITDPKATYKRPLGDLTTRESQKVSLRALRLAEDAAAKINDESKDDDGNNSDMDVESYDNNAADNGGGGGKKKGKKGKKVKIAAGGRSRKNANNNYGGSDPNHGSDYGRLSKSHSIHEQLHIHETQFNIHLKTTDFEDVMQTWNISEPLGREELENMFTPLIKKLHQKVEKQWDEHHKKVDKKIMKRSWEGQFNHKMSKQNCKRWTKALKEKVPNGKFTTQVSLLTFNQIIADMISSNLGSVVLRRKSQIE